MAEGALRQLAAKRQPPGVITVDSAGTGAWHVGEPPDARAQDTARARGIDISSQRARQIGIEDFEEFDLIIAMDNANITNLKRLAPPKHQHKIVRFLDFAGRRTETEVPDPYYGGPDGFDHTIDLILDAAQGLADHIESTRE
jgi:protein-tyrosine phosphatase